MPMKGFNPIWTDLPDYILGITRDIWEHRNVAGLHHWYGPDMIKRAPDGVVLGAQAVIDETAASLAAAPDMQILGEDVIWSGDAEVGFLSSHRVMNLATRTDRQGRGVLVRERVIADCFCTGDQITDEWLAFDRGATVRQLGFSPEEAARAEVEAEGGPERARRPFHAGLDRSGPYGGRGNGGEWGERYADLLARIMSADFAALPRIYDRAAHLEHPGGFTRHGVAEADRFWLSLRAALPSAKLDVQHVISRDDPSMPPRAAVRWALTGRHDGRGLWGAPSGADLHVWGFSHAEWGPWGLRREWIVLDEVQVWKQILLARG